MEYIDEQKEKRKNTQHFDISKLQGEGELTKPSRPQMTSFRLYTGKPEKKKKSHKSKDEKKEMDVVEKSKVKTASNDQLKPAKKKKEFILFKRVTLTDTMLFMDNMSTMLRAGLALAPAIKTIKGEIKNKYFKEILDYLYVHIENGQTLSTGMKNYPKAFSDMVIATVEVGENTGMLSDTFGHLADIMKRQRELRRKVVGALMYPSIVILALIGVSLFLSLVIFPQLIGLFEGAGVDLPFILVAVNSINFFLTNYWQYAIGGLVAVIIILKIVFSKPGPKLFLHAMLLKLPFVGKLIQEFALATFAGNLNALLGAGLAIVQSMEIVAQTVGNLKYRKNILVMAKELEKGKSLHSSMAKRPGLFPSLTIQLINVGESTGQLEEILGKISEFYETRVNNVLNNLSTILEPALLVIVGVAVGFIAVSVIGPMYELTNSFAE